MADIESALNEGRVFASPETRSGMMMMRRLLRDIAAARLREEEE